jgi:hypothetical protein
MTVLQNIMDKQSIKFAVWVALRTLDCNVLLGKRLQNV